MLGLDGAAAGEAKLAQAVTAMNEGGIFASHDEGIAAASIDGDIGRLPIELIGNDGGVVGGMFQANVASNRQKGMNLGVGMGACHEDGKGIIYAGVGIYDHVFHKGRLSLL